MTPLETYRATGQRPDLAARLAAVGCVDELDGFAGQMRADGRLDADAQAAVARRRADLMRGL